MNITLENNDAQVSTLTVKVEQADYNQQVAKSLKDIRKNAVIKGFRPGNAPASLIAKMYRKSALVEEVNELVSRGVSNYLMEQKLNILGEPLPSENQQSIDWDNQEDFEFQFDIALIPEFTLTLNKRDKVVYHTIEVDENMRNSYIDGISGRHGNYQSIEQADDSSLLAATLTELDAEEAPKADGVTVENGKISLMLVSDETEKAKLVGAKTGDVVVLDVTKAFPNETDRAALLNVEKEELPNISTLFQATITEVQEWAKAEVNQELFDKVFGEGVVTSIEEFHEKVDTDIKANLKFDSERKLYMDIREKLVKKIEVELPKEFLVRWLVAINEGKFTVEEVENDYPHFEDDLKWQLIRDRIATEQEFKVEEEELQAAAKGYISSQMIQYGMNQLPEEFITKYATDMLSKPEERRKFAEQVLENKVVEWVKETIKIDEKEVSFDKFKEIVSKK